MIVNPQAPQYPKERIANARIFFNKHHERDGRLLMDDFMRDFATLLGYFVILACCARVLVPVVAEWVVGALNTIERLRQQGLEELRER
jgi:hypothetical protein